MSEGFGWSDRPGNGGRSKNTDRMIVDGVKKLTGLQKILRKYPDDPEGRKKMLKAWKKYHYGWLGEMDRLEQDPELLENVPLAMEELESITEDMPKEPIVVDQEPTPEQVEQIRNALRKE